MRRVIAFTILLIAVGCSRTPAASTTTQTDTVQSTPTSTSGTTATETGGGAPVKTDTTATHK